ncbi:hypothetical protein ISCGN_001341 [Ixodes scapularis]
MAEGGRVVSCEEAEVLLRDVDSYRLCGGAVPTSEVPRSYLTKGLEGQVVTREGTYFSNRCTGKEPSEGQACISCRYLRKALLTRRSRVQRSVKKHVRSITQKLRAAAQKNRRLLSRNANLQAQLKQMQDDNASKPDEVLQAEIATLPPKQQECVRQCFSAAKKRGLKGNTYSKDWVLECILMKMKSARLYEHLRKHDIISLPSKSTLKRYLRIYKSGYGFNHKTVLHGTVECGKSWESALSQGKLPASLSTLLIHLGISISCQIFLIYSSASGNTLLKYPLNTPDGMVSMRPVREAFKKDSSNVTLKAMPGLTSVHLQPNGFEKMRVSFAFQLFGDRVINGLQFFQDELESSCSSFDATLSFFRTINSLIKIMTSRFTAKALRPGSKEVEFLKEFLDFLSSWESVQKEWGDF